MKKINGYRNYGRRVWVGRMLVIVKHTGIRRTWRSCKHRRNTLVKESPEAAQLLAKRRKYAEDWSALIPARSQRPWTEVEDK